MRSATLPAVPLNQIASSLSAVGRLTASSLLLFVIIIDGHCHVINLAIKVIKVTSLIGRSRDNRLLQLLLDQLRKTLLNLCGKIPQVDILVNKAHDCRCPCSPQLLVLAYTELATCLARLEFYLAPS